VVRSMTSLKAEYKKITPKSMAQWELGKPIMPGGLIKGAYWSDPYPIYIERAEGCYLWDLDGRRYVDFENHHTATILGHSHPEVVESIQNTLNLGIAHGGPTKLEAEVSAELIDRIPSVEKVRFTNSGTEASLHATRMVRMISGKSKLAKFEGNYHGSHDALEVSVSPSLDQAGPEDTPNSVDGWKGMSNGSSEDVVVLPHNKRESVELILREQKDEVAAVFYDGRPGFYDTSHDFVRWLRQITEELGILLVMDEVVSFRVGRAGFQGVCDVMPDLTILGKVVGGGLPVGAIGGRGDLMDVLDNTVNTGLYQSGTYSGNMFTLAAGLATLRALTPEVYSYMEYLGEQLYAGLKAAFMKAGIPHQVLQEGSIVGYHLTDQPVTDYRSACTVNRELTDRIGIAMMVQGYFARATMGMIISQPMKDEHIDSYLQDLESILLQQD